MEINPFNYEYKACIPMAIVCEEFVEGVENDFCLFSIPLGILFNMFEEMHIIVFPARHHSSFHKKRI